ncbi:uncharacterized protein PV07_04113 [Cladophialophora immunda]|uniref:Enoyl reductase (ER) domain-containing protein n=1 Tax=Cladophialophora immunda TaxID=569365 RepID=A0A0D2CMY2_9EURO|nr:uncharacterized protein PV07_04113 [Cladophialophora immunda]KIW32583.1 hypothetical protein PV07_04113 [Cladophialophora immunda]
MSTRAAMLAQHFGKHPRLALPTSQILSSDTMESQSCKPRDQSSSQDKQQAQVIALRFYDKETVKVDRISALTCQADEVRIQIAYCGICGSDIHEYQHGPHVAPAQGSKHPYSGVQLPVILGHEMSGTIVEIGSKVSGLQVGQRVAVNPSLDDRSYDGNLCPSCQRGQINICKRWGTYGYNAPSGGFATEAVVKSFNCFPIPDNVPLSVGALAEPLAVAWHMIRVSEFKRGQTALILGAGPIGIAILLGLKSMGASVVIVTEIADGRARQAATFGADIVINPLKPQSGDSKRGDAVTEAVSSLTKDGVDVAFDASGLQSTLDAALASTRPGGTICNVAIRHGPVKVDLNELIYREKRIVGGICYTTQDFKDVIAAMGQGEIPFEAMITSIVPLEDAHVGGILELIKNKSNHLKILISPQS